MAKEHELKSHISSIYDVINAVSVDNFNLLREKLGSTTSVTPEYSLSSQITLLNKLKILDTKLPNTLETSVVELPLLEEEDIEEISGGVYGNGTYVAITDCNSDIVLVSYTGQKWKKIHTGLSGYRNQICYVNGYFVTASYDEMWYEYSKDGINWTRKELTFIPSYICSTDNVLYFISVTEAASSYTIKVKYTINIEEPTFTAFSYVVPTYISGDFNNNSNKCIALSNTQIVLIGVSSIISIIKDVTGYTTTQTALNMKFAVPVFLKSRHDITKGILYRFASSDTLIYTKVNGDTVTYTDINVQDTNITKDTIAIMLDRDWDKTNDTGYMVINKTSVYTNTKLLSIVDNYVSYPVDLTRSICVYGDVSFILLKKNFTKLNLVDYISKKSLVDETSDMYTMSLDDTIRNIPVMLENVSNGYDRSGYYRTTSGSFSVSSGAFIDITLPSKAEMILVYAKTSTAKTYLVKVINDEGQFQKYLYDTNQHVLKERRAEIIRQEKGKYITEYSKETKIVNTTFHFVNSSEFTDFSYIAICSKIGNAYTVDEPALEPFELLSMKEVSYSNALCVHNDLVIGCSANGKDLILSSGSSNITKNIISSSENVKITSVYYSEDNNLYIGTDTNRIYIGTIDSNNMIDNLSLYTLDVAASIKFIKSIVYNNETILFAIGPDMTHIYYKTLSETSWTKYTDFTDSKTLKEVVVHGDILYLIPTSSKYIVTIRKNASGYVSSTINVTTEDITWGGCIANNSRVCLIDNSVSYLYYTDKGTSSAFKKVNIGSYGTTFVRGMYINGLYYIFLKDSKTCYAIYSSNLQYWEEIEMIDEAPYSNIRMSLDSAWYTNGYFVLVLSGGLASLRYEVYGSRDDRPVMLCVNGVEIPNKTVHRLYGYGETANLTFYDYRTNSFIPLADITNLRIEGTGATLLNGVITFTAVGSVVVYYTYNNIKYTSIIAYRPYAADIQLTFPDRLYLNEANIIPIQPLPSNTTYASLTGTFTDGNADIGYDDTNLIVTPKQTGALSGRIYMNLENGNRISKEFSVTVYERIYPSDITVTYPKSYIHTGTSMTPTIAYEWEKSGDYIQQVSDLEFSLTASSDIIDKVHIDTNGKLTLDEFDLSVGKTIVVIVKTMNNLTKQVSINTVRTISDIAVENDLLISSPYDYTATGTHHVDINYTPSAITEPDLLFVSKIMPSETDPDKIPYGISMGSFSNGLLGVDIGTNWHPGEGILEICRGPKSANPNTIMKKINIVYPHIRNTNVVNTEDNLFTTSRLYHICPLEDTLLVLIIGTFYILEVSKIDYHIIRRIELPSKIGTAVNKLFYLDGAFILTSDNFTTSSTATPPTGYGQLWASIDLTNWINYGILAPLFGANMTVNRVKIVDKKVIFLCTGRILYCKLDWDTNRTSFYPTCGTLSTGNTVMTTYEWIDCAIGTRLVFLASSGHYIQVDKFGDKLSETIVNGIVVSALTMAATGRVWKCVGYLKESFIFMATDHSMELINHHLRYAHIVSDLGMLEAASDITDMTLFTHNNTLFLFVIASSSRYYYIWDYYAVWTSFSNSYNIAGKNLNLAPSEGKLYSLNQYDNRFNETTLISLCQSYYSNTIPSKLLETGRTFTKCVYYSNAYIALSGKRIYVCNDSLITYYEYPDADITSFDDIYTGLWVNDIVIYSNTSRKFIVLHFGISDVINTHIRVCDLGIDVLDVSSVFYNGTNLLFLIKMTYGYLIQTTADYVNFTTISLSSPSTTLEIRPKGIYIEAHGIFMCKTTSNTYALYRTTAVSSISRINILHNSLPTEDSFRLIYGNKRALILFERSMAYYDTVGGQIVNINQPYGIMTNLYETVSFNCGVFAYLAKNSSDEYYIMVSKDCESWTRRKVDSDTYISLMMLPDNTIHLMTSLGKVYKYKLSYQRYGCAAGDSHQLNTNFAAFSLMPTTTVRRMKTVDEYHFVMFNSPSANSLFYVCMNMATNKISLPGNEVVLDVFVYRRNYIIATKITCYVLTQNADGTLTNPVPISTTAFAREQCIVDLVNNNQHIVGAAALRSADDLSQVYIARRLRAVCASSDGSLIYKTVIGTVSIPGNSAYPVKVITESRGHNDLIFSRDGNGDYITKVGERCYVTHITFTAGEILDIESINDSIVILSNQNKIVRYPINMDWNMGSVYWLPEGVVDKQPKLMIDDSRFILCTRDALYESFDGITWVRDNVPLSVDGDPYSNYAVLGGGVIEKWSYNTNSGNFRLTYICKNR